MYTHTPVWGRSPTSTLVCWVGSQRVPEVACFALVAVGAGCVVDALETPARQAVTVPGGAGIHVVVTLTGLTRPQWATFPKGVPKVALGTEFAAGTWKDQMDKSWGHPSAARPDAEAGSTQGVQRSLARAWLLLSSELDGGAKQAWSNIPEAATDK